MSADEITPQSLQFANAINEVAKSLDTLKHNLAEAELTAERERADRNQEDALTLMRALIKVRQQMFPQHDQRAVVSRDFPKLAAIDSARRK